MTHYGKVVLVGAGPGAVDLITLRAIRLIETAKIIVYDRLVSPEILALAPADARLIDVGKIPKIVNQQDPNHKCRTIPQTEINEMLVTLTQEGHDVLRLKGGDPLIFGRGSEEAVYLHKHGIEVEYCPGITSAQGVASATGIPLTHRGLAGSVRYFTGHCRDNIELEVDWHSMVQPDMTLVIYMGLTHIEKISHKLMEHGMPADMPVLAIANATTPRQYQLISSIDKIANAVQEAGFKPPTLFVIGEVVSLYSEVGEGLQLSQMVC